MALDTSQPYAGDSTLINIPLTVLTGCREITEAGPTGAAATSTKADHPTEEGSLTEAFPKAPTKASAPAAAPPKTTAKGARGDHLTMEEDVQPHTGIRLVMSSHPPLPDK